MDRRAQLRAARLYFICGPMPGGQPLVQLLPKALAGGVDVFQLRAKDYDDEQVLRAAVEAAAICRKAGALFVLNDRPDLAKASGADGVHVGQEDMAINSAREIVGDEMLVGVSTHAPEQLSAAATAGADYAGVGPVHATPTKPGRAPVGLEYVRHAAAAASIPFFAIGGIDASNVGEIAAAGAERVAVVRAIAEAADPEQAARALRRGLIASSPSARGEMASGRA